MQGHLLEQPNAFICFFAPTPPSAQPEPQTPLPEDVFPLLKMCDLKICSPIKPVPEEQKA